MQTCSLCNATSPDKTIHCSHCQVDLREFSTTAIALKRFQANTRVKAVRLSVASDACPVCNEAQGTFRKKNVPRLPVEGCSHENGCRCFYEPVIGEL